MRRLLPCLLIGSILLSACATGYVARSRGARHDFQKGNLDKALRWYAKQSPPRRDRLLYLLDQGLILHTMGHYRESIDLFDKAIDLSETMESSHVVAKTAAIATTDNAIPYQGEKFETLLMHVFQVLNYLGLEKNNEALVEIRRIHTKFSDFFREGAKDYLQNAFATYLAATVWEAEGKINDAYIDYKTTYRLRPSFSPVANDLLKGSYWLGFLNDYDRWGKKFQRSFQPLPRGHGEVILFLEEGVVPEKESSEEDADLQVVPVPRYPDSLGTPVQIHVSASGKSMATSQVLFRPDEAAKKTLADQKAAIIARAIARLAAKETGAVILAKEVNADLGILFGILVLTTNRADLRSWLTLPRSLQVVRFSLPEGLHDVTLTWGKQSRLLKQVLVKAGKKRFLSCRMF